MASGASGSSNDPPHGLPPLLPLPLGMRRDPNTKPKRTRISTACEPCRARKTKCNGERPRCHECIVRDTNCRYTETDNRAMKQKYEQLREQKTAHEELIELLKSVPEKDSIHMLQRLRAGQDIQSILDQVKDADLLMQLSLVPEAHRGDDFPHISGVSPFILFQDNLYLDSLLYETTFRRPTQPPNSIAARNGISVDEYQSAYLQPYHAAEMVDPLLLRVTPSQWTNVTSNDDLLRHLLSTYFLYQHQCYFPFHKDLFLEDMASGCSEFCSSLLVNATLALACNSYHELTDRTQFHLPQNLVYQFTAEAKRLWELEGEQSSITAIQAAIILDIKMNISGQDRIGASYLYEALAMVNDLKLFEASSHPVRTTELSEEEKRIEKGRVFTAWSLFSWQASSAYYFLRSPFYKSPPESSLPDPMTEAQWYGEVWLQYPMSQTLTPCQLGYIINARINLRSILNEIAIAHSEIEGSGELSLEQALGFDVRLEAWHDSLHGPLTPRNIVFPTQFELHIEYQTTRIALLAPHLARNASSFSVSAGPTMKTLQQLVVEAQVRLETLFRLYYLRYSFDHYHCYIQNFLIALANVVIKSINDHLPSSKVTVKTLRSVLMLCAIGLQHQGKCYYVANLTFLAIQSRMKKEDIQILRTYTSTHPGEVDGEILPDSSTSKSKLPITGTDGDPELLILGQLLKEWEEVPGEEWEGEGVDL